MPCRKYLKWEDRPIGSIITSIQVSCSFSSSSNFSWELHGRYGLREKQKATSNLNKSKGKDMSWLLDLYILLVHLPDLHLQQVRNTSVRSSNTNTTSIAQIKSNQIKSEEKKKETCLLIPHAGEPNLEALFDRDQLLRVKWVQILPLQMPNHPHTMLPQILPNTKYANELDET